MIHYIITQFSKCVFWFLILAIGSCKSSDLKIQTTELIKVANAERGIIVSCIRCKCVDEVLQNNYKGLIAFSITVYVDKKCRPNINELPFSDLSQEQIDSIYSRNYNMILFDISKGKQKYYLLKTEESGNFKEIFYKFFRVK
jgi:hypothetical protein